MRRTAIQRALKKSHHQSLVEFSALSGVPIEALLDEAIDDFIECCISVRTETIAERAASA